jgi:membrane protein implicated in regulation of membrane protease activity
VDPLLWALLLLAAGILLLVAEFFLPSGGALAVLSAGCIVGSLVVPFFAEEGVWWRASVVLLVAMVGVPVTLRATIDLWPRSAFGRLLLIELPKRPEDVLPEEALALKDLIGRVGVAKSPMRPSGTVAIDGVHYSAQSEGMPIEKGDRVKTVAVRMRQLVVVPAREADLVAAGVEPQPVRRSPASSHGEKNRALDAKVAVEASSETLKQSDDLAASIEALELFVAGKQSSSAADEEGSSAGRPSGS